MSDEIQFGELEESVPECRLPPNENKQFVVAAIGDPANRDLPIFVDMDVMLDMERHSLTDTSVELGGVMLGGQFEDKDGQAFVLVSDSLRAEHYESTKGSFKFTHETWASFTRKRDQFPDDLQMVGWYHTHPDWGVFLSGMDMFICDNFFNRPLDIALVIDPCRDDRGMFHWLQDSSGQQIHQTDGFYLFSSRLRQSELIEFCQHLQMGENMSDPRFVPSGASSAAPVVHIHDQRGQTMVGAVTGAMMFQFFLLLIIGWKVFSPFGFAGDEESESSKVLVAINDKLAGIEGAADAQRQGELKLWEAQIKLQTTERALQAADKLVPGELTRLAENEVQLATLREHLRSSAAHSETLNARLDESMAQRERTSKRQSLTEKALEKSNNKIDELKKETADLAADVKKLKSDDASSAMRVVMSDPRWVVGLIIATIMLVGGTAYATLSISGVSQAVASRDAAGATTGVPPVESNWTDAEEDGYAS
jgi:proteasome lid subunit RPN8/RPN11/cell division protein FtsB